MKDNIFDVISPDEALEILTLLARKDKTLSRQIIELAEKLIRSVNVDEICEAVFSALDEIDVHELWDRAGPSRDGYISPEDMSFEMFEEALEPFIQEMHRLIDLKMHQESKLYCMGILKGIYDYEENSESEFKSWAIDIPGEAFVSILNDWGKNSSDKDKTEMKDFIHEECQNWFEWSKPKI